MNATFQQLALPFDYDVMHTWTDAVGPADRSIELTASLTDRGARLKLVGPWPEDGRLPAADGQPVRGVLWQAEVDMREPGRTVIAPTPEHGLRVCFATRLPFSTCFTAPIAWASLAGAQQGLPVEGLLRRMSRTLTTVARHLERLQSRFSAEGARAAAILGPAAARSPEAAAPMAVAV